MVEGVHWMIPQPALDAAGWVFVALAALTFAFCVWSLVFEAKHPVREGALSTRTTPRSRYLRSLALSAVFFTGWYLLAAVAGAVQQGGGPFAAIARVPSLMTRWDAPHYLGIARDWYVTEGDARFHIVFFPLFPLLVRAVSFVVRNAFWASALVNVLATSGALYLFDDYARSEGLGDRGARQATLNLMLYPWAFFLCAPYSEAVTLLLFTAVFFFLRRRRYLLAAVAGGLVAFTRSVGVFVAIPYAITALLDCIHSSQSVRARVLLLIRRAGIALIIPAGLAAYILVNLLVTGDPLKFLEYQSDHWSQRIGWFFETLKTTLKYTLDYDLEGIVCIWLPQLIIILAGAALLPFAVRRLKASAGLWCTVYFYFIISPTWLLSGPRYAFLMFPIAVWMAKAIHSRTAALMFNMVMLAAQVFYCVAFALGHRVY